MRNLTIKREKTYVASLCKMKVYIEDPAYAETSINNIPCRKIGELKNGEQKTFLIEDYPLRVFVIADKLSKNYCNDFYEIPAGTEDIFLCGKNKFDFAGNAFCFYNNPSQSAVNSRKKGKRIGTSIFLIAVLVGVIAGNRLISPLFEKKAEPKQFTKEGMSITLSDDFRKTDMEGFTLCLDSSDVAVFAVKEGFALMDGFEKYTLSEYGALVLKNNQNVAELKTKDGLTYFQHEYLNKEENNVYSYSSFLYKAGDAFWIVQFATLKENAEKYESKIFDWAHSVRFEESNKDLNQPTA